MKSHGAFVGRKVNDGFSSDFPVKIVKFLSILAYYSALQVKPTISGRIELPS